MKNMPSKIFLSGIGGSGVSAIASFLADKGATVVGSDRSFDRDPDTPLRALLLSKGIAITRQDGSGIDKSIDLAIFSTAVEHDQPEYVRAHELNIPMKMRPHYLADMSESFTTIAVSGTSGKSTTAGMLAFLMLKIGLDPNFIGGGRVKQFTSLSNPGNALSGRSDYLVMEACESDGSIVNYRPAYSILLNLALDHNPVAETGEMFETLITNTSRKVIINADDTNLPDVSGEMITRFSIDDTSPFKAEKVEYRPFSTSFSVNDQEFVVSLPGKHNLYNALSCIAFLSEIGVSLDVIAHILPDFRGIERRFDIHLNTDNCLVIDDYAHNPHKISSLMKTVRALSDRTCYIFQPHGFGPTRLMKDEYISTFKDNLRETDHLVLLPIYYSGGTVARDISSNDLALAIQSHSRSAEVIEDRREIPLKINEYRNFVVFGARDESLADLAWDIAATLKREILSRGGQK